MIENIHEKIILLTFMLQILSVLSYGKHLCSVFVTIFLIIKVHVEEKTEFGQSLKTDKY